MSTTLQDLSRLSMHPLVFDEPAKACGFASAGDIERFLFTSYGKTIREIAPANRPKGAIFFLGPPATFGALATVPALKTVLLQIRTDVARKFYMVPIDLSGGVTVAYEPKGSERQTMVGGVWTSQHAQALSKTSGRCVVWATAVGVVVFLNGDCYYESPDVVEAIPAGLPSGFQALSWDDGEIVYEFAKHDLNDTTPSGIWHLPDQLLLRPKPEKLMSVGLGKFLKHRMAGYGHHGDECHVENQGRADIELIHYNDRIDIVEVKWVGCALVGPKQLEPEDAIKAALKLKTKGWLTEYGDETFVTGTKQLAVYMSTGRYQRAYLVVFDCKQAAKNRQSESLPVDNVHVAPLNPADFRVLRACVDPRKASTVSKAKQP
jgi:hypothetical protein